MSIMDGAMKTKQVKPILKWAGGKQSLAEALTGAFPTEFDRLFEPFVGGASVFLKFQPKRAVLGDENSWLIDTYSAVRSDWQKVACCLDSLPNKKEDFLKIRGMNPRRLSLYKRAAYLIYLNKTCFRGLFRVNQKNEFNVPYGAYNRRYYDPENMRAVASAFQGVEFRCGDFELCIHDLTSRDFVYFDPPYYKLGGYSDFNRYTAAQCRENDHIRLAAVCRELDWRNIRWAVSNSATAFVKRLFEGFHIRVLGGRREINLSSSDRSVPELLITNY